MSPARDTPFTEDQALHAVNQARKLRHQASLAAGVAEQQAVGVLLDQGMSHRTIAKLTGFSKSQVSRLAKSSPPLGVAVSAGSDTRVYGFADE